MTEQPRVDQPTVSEVPWSIFTQSDFTLEQWRAACLLDTGTGASDSKGRYKLPVREPSGALNRNGVRAMAYKIHTLEDISDEQRSAAARKLLGLYRDIKEDAPEYLSEIANMVVDEDFFDADHAMPLRDALVPPEKRGMSLRDAQRRMGIIPDDGARLSLSDAVDQVKGTNRGKP
jgi:hypothetical protein